VWDGQDWGNIGGSTAYGYSGPASDTAPQFYASVESHAPQAGVGYEKIYISGTDPNGLPLTGDRFNALTILHSPESGPTDPTGIMQVVLNYIANVIPYGAGQWLTYVASSSGASTGYDSSHAWGAWTTLFLTGRADDGIRFGFKLAVDPTLPGTYRIHLDYLVSLWVFDSLGNYGYGPEEVVSQDQTYCYQYC
jgi:hypothetical protein